MKTWKIKFINKFNGITMNAEIEAFTAGEAVEKNACEMVGEVISVKELLPFTRNITLKNG